MSRNNNEEIGQEVEGKPLSLEQTFDQNRFDWNSSDGEEVIVTNEGAEDHNHQVAAAQLENFSPSPIPPEEFECNNNQQQQEDIYQNRESVLRRKKTPKSPINAYDLYSQHLRDDFIISANKGEGKRKTAANFQYFSKSVERRWKSLTKSERKVFEDRAMKDTMRYKREMSKHKKRETTSTMREDESVVKYPPPRLSMGNRSITHPPQHLTTLKHSPLHPVGVAQRLQQQQQRQPYGYSRPSYNPNMSPYRDFPPRYPPFPPGNIPPQWVGGSLPSSPSFHRQPYSSSFDSTMQQRTPPPFQNPLIEGEPQNSRTLPPGSDVCLRDEQTGEMRSFTVQYSLVKMTKQEARDFLFKRRKTNTP